MSESTKATIEILEHYHHNGGFYEIPVEVINTIEQELEEQEKEIERLNNIIKTKDEGIKAFTEDLCETTEELEKANNKIKMALDYIQNAKGKDINYVATLLLGYPIEISEMREQLLESIGSDKH